MKPSKFLITLLFWVAVLGCKKTPDDAVTPYTPVIPGSVDPRPVEGDLSLTITDKSIGMGLMRRIPSLKVDILVYGDKNDQGFLTNIKSLVIYNPNTLDWVAAKIENGYPTTLALSTGYFAELKDYDQSKKTVKIKLSLNGQVVKDYYTQQVPDEFFKKVEQYSKLKNGRLAAKSDCETMKDAAKWAGAVGSAVGCGMGFAFPLAGIAGGLGTVANCLSAVDSAWELLSPDHKPLSDKLLGDEAGEKFRNAVDVAGLLGGGKVLGEGKEAVNALNDILDKFGKATTGAGYFPCDNPVGHSTGDPHLTSLDGLHYDFQGHGEFIAAKSSTDNFEVQVRQEDVNNTGKITMNTAVGIQTGTDVVCVMVNPDRLFINNLPQNLTTFTSQSLEDGAKITKVKDGSFDVLNIYHKNGDLVKVQFHGSYYLLDYSVYLTDSRKGKVFGLVGDYDGNKDNDVQIRNGNVLSGQSSIKFSDMYPTFADSWRISQVNSLFYYDPGKTTDTYTRKDFPKEPVSLTADQKAKAETICRAAGVTNEPFLSGCIVDVALTGDASLASSSLWGQKLDSRPAGIPVPVVAEAISVKRITYFDYNTFLLKSDGTLWVAGDNSHGRFGIGTTPSTSTRGFIQIMTGIKDIASGYNGSHMLFLKNDNTVWAAGYNSAGQIGNGATDGNNVPTAVKIMSDGQALAIGAYNSFVIKTDNTLWAFGGNGGLLGDGTKTDRAVPVKVMDNVKAVSAGQHQTLILKTDNTLWGTGSSLFGALGIPLSIVDILIPIKLMDDVLSMATGEEHSLVLKSDNTLWASGDNSLGQLGIGTDGNGSDLAKFTKVTDKVQAISVGSYHSLILKTDNTLWTTGFNREGQFGNGTQTNRNTFGQVLSGVKYVVTGGGENGSGGSTFIVKTDNTLWGAGDNYFGQLGFSSPPDQTSVFVPIVVK